MSWQPCGAAESSYPLAVPAALIRRITWLHAGVAISTLVLSTPTEGLVLLWLGIWRSWRMARRQQARAHGWTMYLDRRGRIRFDDTVRSRFGTESSREYDRSAQGQGKPLARVGHPYTVCRSFRAPGCVSVGLADGCGKRLEILVFYRYDQRETYRRWWRFLALQ